MRLRAFYTAFAGLCGFLVCACAASTPPPRSIPAAPKGAGAVAVGPGYYVTERPKGGAIPQNEAGKVASPKVTADFNLPVTSNSWWSSLIWQWDTDNPYSEPLYAHPLAMQAEAAGLGLSYPTELSTDHMQYMFRHDKDLVVGLVGMKSPDTKVANYSDWGVTAHWQHGRGHLRATLAHGLPYAYFERKGAAQALVHVSQSKREKLKVWYNSEGALGLSLGEHHYGVFGPTGSEWLQDNQDFTNDLLGKSYWSVAVLPDASPSTFELFRRHGHAHVTDTRVSYEYDEKAATVSTTFKVETTLKEQSETLVNEPLLALYRHQWLNCDASYLPHSFVSPRGAMKLIAAKEFTTQVKWHGVLPILPHVVGSEEHAELGFDEGRLSAYVDQVYQASELFPKGLTTVPTRDTYWIGKSLGKHATVLQIADQLGKHEARDHLLQAIKNELQDWFDGRTPHLFYYNKQWRTLIGYPDSYMSGGQMNDHHFHYAYYVMSAAIVARFDPAWAKKWGDFIDLLIADPANWDRTDQRFPFLRQMDVYAGHSWANGPSLFKEGNNQEASSEDTNFSTAVILWGAITGRKAIRDLGIFLHANQVEAIKQYWFDVDQKVIPKEFDKVVLAMVWGAGGWYNTWFDEDPNVLHGINFIPFSGGSLYHGRWPEYVKRNFEALNQLNRGEIWTWRDLILMHRALGDPAGAVEMFEQDPDYQPEFGNTRATIQHWVYNLAAMGLVDTQVTADTPTYSVFQKAGTRTYVAFNPGQKPRKVTFSDGTTLSVAAGKSATLRKAVAAAAAE